MGKCILFVVAIFITSYTDGRVYYVDNLDGIRNNDAIYPIVDEPSSRDLDLAFSAGDSDNENIVSPTKKLYTLVPPEKPYMELNRNVERPIAYYRLSEPATRRSSLDDIVFVPGKGRKLTKLNDNNNNNKGEVILELRVIANHDSA